MALKGTDRLPVRLVSKVLINLMVDVFRQKSDAAVSERKVGAADMCRLESQLSVPITGLIAFVCTGCGCLAAIEIDRNDGGH